MATWKLEYIRSGFLAGSNHSLSPDGSFLAAPDWDNSVLVYAVRSFDRPVVLTGHSGFVDEVSFLDTGNRLLSYSAGFPDIHPGDQTVRIWDLDFECEVNRVTIPHLRDVVHSNDGRFIAAAARMDTCNCAIETQLWDVFAGTRLSNFIYHPITDQTVVYIDANKEVVAAYGADGLDMWAIGDAELLFRIPRPSSHRKLINSRGRLSHVPIMFSPDGKYFAVRLGGAAVSIWDFDRGVKVCTLNESTAYAQLFGFSADGSRLLIGLDAEQRLAVFDVQSGKLVCQVSNAKGIVWSKLNADATQVVSHAGANKIEIWDATNGSLLNQLSPTAEQKQQVRTQLFSVNKTMLNSASLAMSIDCESIVSGYHALHVWKRMNT